MVLETRNGALRSVGTLLPAGQATRGGLHPQGRLSALHQGPAERPSGPRVFVEPRRVPGEVRRHSHHPHFLLGEQVPLGADHLPAGPAVRSPRVLFPGRRRGRHQQGDPVFQLRAFLRAVLPFLGTRSRQGLPDHPGGPAQIRRPLPIAHDRRPDIRFRAEAVRTGQGRQGAPVVRGIYLFHAFGGRQIERGFGSLLVQLRRC
mmetsp:Transcript_29863/g.63940  ORF Transcript_29863/g.63940 Transcript_29863/m.63940 type:complete len:203 (-) Transcript_29863:742-1350(-)